MINEIYNLSNKTKYAEWYVALCKRGQERIKDTNEYYEKHHIIPKCMKGGNSKKNITHLTGREHFIAHLLLTKMFHSTNQIIRCKAALGGFMSQNKNGVRLLNSRQIQLARKAKSESLKNIPKTQAHRDKIGAAHKGVPKSATAIENNRLAHIGQIVTDETIDKRRDSLKKNRAELKLSNFDEFERKRISRVNKVSRGTVIIQGVSYPSIQEAARSIGRNPDYVKRRVFLDTFPDWVFLPRETSL